MREYLEDISKGQIICIKELNPKCDCCSCKQAREEKRKKKLSKKLYYGRTKQAGTV